MGPWTFRNIRDDENNSNDSNTANKSTAAEAAVAIAVVVVVVGVVVVVLAEVVVKCIAYKEEEDFNRRNLNLCHLSQLADKPIANELP